MVYDLPPSPYDSLDPKKVVRLLELNGWIKNRLPRLKGSLNQDANVHIDDLFWCLARYRIDYDTIMMLFALSLGGQVKGWYDNIPPKSVVDYDRFEDIFLGRWSNLPY